MNTVQLCLLLLKGTMTAFAGLASLPVARDAQAATLAEVTDSTQFA